MDVSLLSDKPVSRLYFLDHLRATLIILVVVFHLALMYGASAPFYYVEPPYNDAATFLVLFLFVLFNQAYFMGALSLISGYFTPRSYERKGPRSYVKDRLVRLGVPILVYMFVLNPIAWIGIYSMPSDLTKITEPFTWQDYPKTVGIGPLWFAEMLLVFAAGYVAWRAVSRSRVSSPNVESAPPLYRAIGAFTLALAVFTYLWRIAMPVGSEIPYLGFPSLSYLPQYVSFFALGCVAFRRDWFRTIPDSMGRAGFIGVVVATILLLPLALSGEGAFLGGGTAYSFAYALWDSIVAVGMFLGLLTLFRRRFARTGWLGRFLSEQSFAVYVIHTPVIVLLGLALRDLHPPQFVKFGLAAVIAVPLCFAVAYLIRRIPGVARIV